MPVNFAPYDHTRPAADFIADTIKLNNRANISRVVKEMLGKPTMRTLGRVDNFLADRGFDQSRDDLVQTVQGLFAAGQLEAIDYIAASFATNASKQGYTEKCVKHVFEFNGIECHKLPSSGPLRRILKSDGTIVNSGVKSERDIDFHMIAKGRHFYVGHKYGRAVGGHQLNQLPAAQAHLENGSKYVRNNDDDIHFVALMDGAYMESKIPFLQAEVDPATSHRVFACNTNQLVAFIESLDE